MSFRKLLVFMFASGGVLLAVTAGISLWLLTPQPVDAQCGSQASSCKNCHEVQAQFSVNSDDTGWHESHAFGDFCYVCHAGNQQATEMDAAHEGLVPPMSDVEASCQQCHSNDLNDRAQVYATILGVSLVGGGTGASALADAPDDSAEEPVESEIEAIVPDTLTVLVPAEAPATACETCVTTLAVDDPNTVDYVQRYNEIVLGQQPVNWGNIILGGLIGLVAVGGGGFVIIHEMQMSAATRPDEGAYSPEVLALLPELAALKPQTRQALRKILANPRRADKVLPLVDIATSTDNPEEKAP